MPKYTKQSLVAKYKQSYPNTNLSDDKLFYEILKSNPNIKNYVSDYNSATSSSILDALPDFIKMGIINLLQVMQMNYYMVGKDLI